MLTSETCDDNHRFHSDTSHDSPLSRTRKLSHALDESSDLERGEPTYEVLASSAASPRLLPVSVVVIIIVVSLVSVVARLRIILVLPATTSTLLLGHVLRVRLQQVRLCASQTVTSG